MRKVLARICNRVFTLLVLTALAWFHFAVAAGEVSVTLTAERTQISLEDQLDVQVSVQGTRQTVTPELLNASNFEVSSTGTSSQVQIINGSVSEQVVFGFSLSPKQAGKFRVGPARVTIDGKSYESATLEVTVAKSGGAGGPGGVAAGQERYSYITAEVDNKSPFVNQQVNYTLKFYNRAQLANAQLGLPEFKGFLKEGPDKQRESEQIINGIPWHVTTMHFALFPMSPGQISIEPARLVADMVVHERGGSFFDDFFSGGRARRVTLRSEPTTLTVTAPPSGSKPAGYTGLVGHFEAHAQLGKQNLAVGDSSTLTVTLAGDGNLRDFALPDISGDDFKVYDDQPVFDLNTGGKPWKETKTFKKALVPLKPGELELPSLHISYFDPSAKSYKILEVPRLVMRVTGSAGGESVNHVGPSAPDTSAKRKIEVLGRDLMPLKRSPGALRSDKLSASEKIAFVAFYFALALSYLLVLFVKRRKDRLSSDKSLQRKRRAFKNFSARLGKLEMERAFYHEASLTLREYLGDKFNVDGKAITPIDAERKLLPFFHSAEPLRKIEAFLRDCEAGQFGGMAASTEGKEVIKKQLVAIVESLEKEARR